MIRRFIETGTGLCGLLLLLAGMAAALFTLQEAWELYENPGSINRFAEQIEADTGLDRQINDLLSGLSYKDDSRGSEDNDAPGNPKNGTAADPDGTREHALLRLSYFISWILVILVLSLLVRVSLATAYTGARILLYTLRRQAGDGDNEDD